MTDRERTHPSRAAGGLAVRAGAAMAIAAATACAGPSQQVSGNRTQTPSQPAAASAEPPATAPAAVPAPDSAPGVRAMPALIRDAPHADAPAELTQYGQLVGTWKCKSSNRLSGAWKDTPGEATWTWFYTLDGHAIQDIWEPSPEGSGAVGVNLRIYDRERGKWRMVWTTAAQPFFDEFEAEFRDGDIVMRGERQERGAISAHTAQITFHAITTDAFSWRYEAAAPGTDQWAEFSRLQCRRVGGLD